MESSGLIEEKNPETQKDNIINHKLNKETKLINILSECSELVPLKFVDSIERLYHTILHKAKYNSLHTLSLYKETHPTKYNLIDFVLKSQSSSKYLKKVNDINCVKIYDDTLFTGERSGYVYMYKIEKGYEMEGFGVTGFNSPVSAIENKKNEYLLVGYENGTINLFDIKKVVLVKSITDIHKTKIVALKFISQEKNNFQIISTDEEGQVMFINSSNTILNKKTIGTIIYKEEEPTYGITKFKPFEDNILTFLTFSCANRVFVYTLEPKLQSIFEIKKPKNAEKNDIPDISMGWGVRPLPESISQKKVNGKKREKEILLAIGWGTVITLYGFKNKGDNYKVEGPIGFYQNNKSIIRIGFFSPSIIYFFDKSTQIKVINTAFCNFGKFEDFERYDNRNALIDEGEKFKNLKYNNASKTKEKEYYYYRNYIHSMKKCIYVFSNDGLSTGKILNYQECIDSIIKNGNNWISAICLAIDIYKGNNNNFLGVPLDEEERKKKLFPHLIQLLNKYIDYNFNRKEESMSDTDVSLSSNENIFDIKEEKIIECINVSIEFCLEIKAVDYLLKDVETTFSQYGKGDLFYKLFEPFIFSDLLLKEDIGIEALTSLYGAYKIKNELVLLSHLFTHINLNCLNNFMIKKLAVKENLFNLIIFIFSNGCCAEDFFFPISKLFMTYSQKFKAETEKTKNEKIDKAGQTENVSFYDSFIKRGIKGINEMENCKEYIAHKLLWYIEMSLKGNKYASGIEVELLKFQTSSEDFKKFIAYIYFWILQKQIFPILLEFDSYSLFSVISIFFTEPKIIKIIKNFDFSLIDMKLMESFFNEEEFDKYLTRNMGNLLLKTSTMVQKDKKEPNKISEVLKPSSTIIPGKSNINISNLKKQNLREIKEENEKPQETEIETEKKESEKILDSPAPDKTIQDTPNLEGAVQDKDKEGKKEIPQEQKKEMPKGKPKEKLKELKEKEEDKKSNKIKFSMAPSLDNANFNDLNSILEYIIKNVEISQSNELSHLDLDLFLIKYASKCTEPIPEKIRTKVLKGFENLLKFFSEYNIKRKELLLQNRDKFDIHNLSKKSLEPQDPYFVNVFNLLLDLLNSKTYKFSQDELLKLKFAASGTRFTLIKIKIEELTKKYKECLEIFIKQENQKFKENVFIWLEEKFQKFIEEINEEKNKKENETDEKIKDNKISPKNKDFNDLINAVIVKIYDLSKINRDKTKKMVGKYFTINEKLRVYNNLNEDPQIQFEFLEELIYQPTDQMKEEGIEITENLNDELQNSNIDLFKLYLKNKKEKDSIKEEKKIREEFDKLLLSQIHLLIVLKRKAEVINYLKRNIKQYPNYPLREALKECVESDIIDSAVFIFQTLGENRSALNLTKQNLEKAFKKYLSSPDNNEDFLEKLKICTNICIENSESLMKKVTPDKERKEINQEGEELWFDLLKRLYEFEDELEKDQKINKKIILCTLQKGIEDLLKQMCLYVSIQNLVGHVTENQERAQYKEFKSILESMLRSNTSFDRVLNSVMVILKDSIENSESKRKKVIAKGNNYNCKKCDVCGKIFINSREEIIYCFGCGHQSHERCIYKKKFNNENENKIIVNKEEDENYMPECEVCRKNKIETENKSKWEDDDEDIKNVQQVIDEDTEHFKTGKSSDKSKSFKFGNKRDKLRKIAKYDNNYQNEVSMFL